MEGGVKLKNNYENNTAIPNKKNDLQELLEQNLEISQQILKISKKLNSYVRFMRIMGFVKILLILTPLIVAYIYVPKLIDQFKDNPSSYVDMILDSYMGGIINSATKNIDNNIDPNNIPPEYKELLKKQK